MKNTTRIAVSLAVGIVLAGLAAWLMGSLAAIAIPRPFFVAMKEHPVAASLLHTTLLVQLPAVLLAWVLGCVLFRALGRATFPLVLAASAPWLVHVVMGGIAYAAESDLPPAETLGFYFGASWLGILGVPIGLWLAARTGRHGIVPEA